MYKASPIDRIRKTFRALLRSRRGNVMITFAFAMLPIMGAAGAAVEFSRGNSAKSAMQAAADSTALAVIKSAARMSSSDITTAATAYFNATFTRPDVKSVQVSATYSASTAKLSVNASGSMQTSLLGILGKNELAVAGAATASLGGSTKWPVCVLVTDPDSNHTLLVKNQASIDFTNCMVQVNTLNWDAVEARDTSYIHSVNGVNCFTGDIHYGDVTPPKMPTCTMLPDPYSTYNVPTNACTFTNKAVNTSATLSPGTYCGGIKISGSGTVTFSPGVYYIQSGDLQVLNSASVIATGVTFLLSGSSTNLNINTSGTVTLSPVTDSSAGNWAGFVFYWDQPSAKKGQTNLISNATVNASGIFYFVGQTLSITNGAKVTINPGSIIADFILPDSGHLTLNGTINSPTAAQQAMQKSVASTNPVLVK